jgi:hypothetical protein
MYQLLWGYKVEEKLYLGVREQKRLNTADLDQWFLSAAAEIVYAFILKCQMFPLRMFKTR